MKPPALPQPPSEANPSPRTPQQQGSSSSRARAESSLCLTKYPPSPKDEAEASESFRQQAIDKAHEISALSWPQHIENHDLDRRHHHSRRRNSLQQQDTDNASFHSISAVSTLRKRRSGCILGNSTVREAFPAVPGPNGDPPNFLAGTEEDCDVAVPWMVAPIDASGRDPRHPDDFGASVTHKGSDRPASPRNAASIEGPAWEKYYNRHVQLLVSLALFSYVGQCLRYAIEIVFGRACHQPETVGWDLGRWKTCTSDPGTTESTGGAFFSDLPTNLIGCFLTGLLVSGDGESIAVNLPVAALGRTNAFQAWVVTHVGLRTGFCGALTTFASWNTQIVRMACGKRGTALGYSQWVSALWGYTIGFYGALQSYQFGVAVAFALSRRFNPQLAKEADAIMDKKAIGVSIHRELPDFERRFLHSICLEEEEECETDPEDLSEQGWLSSNTNATPPKKTTLARYGTSGRESFYSDHIHHLRAWKETTDHHRNAWSRFSERRTTELHEIERNLLVDRIEPHEELLAVARAAGWDTGALTSWAQAMNGPNRAMGSTSGNKGMGCNERGGDQDLESQSQPRMEDRNCLGSSHHSSLVEAVFNLLCCVLLTGVLVIGFVRYRGRTDVIGRNYRTQCLSALLSPLGTYTRWYLSRLNGSIRHKAWEWFPMGTFLANMFASVVSALTAALLLVWDGPDATVVVGTAIQVGYAGSCSTVSTFATETVGLLGALPRAFWGYYYGFGSVLCAFVLGMCSYFWAVL